MPPIGGMIELIAEKHDKYKDRKISEKFKNRMIVRFIHNICDEEKIGTQGDPGKTKEVYERCLREEELKSEPKDIRETSNLVKAYSEIKNVFLPDFRDNPEYRGLLAVEIIQGFHELALKDLIDANRYAAPGRFSTTTRKTEYEGSIRYYPTYATEEEAFNRVQRIVDQSNQMMEKINRCDSTIDHYKWLFRLATMVLFEFVTVHPFSDGNGRISRLLACYIMMTLTPFPVPIYNVYSTTNRDDFIHAVVKYQIQLETDPQSFEGPSDLLSMLIESTYCAWLQYEKYLKPAEKIESM